MGRRGLTLKEFPSPQRASHCRLVIGTFKFNPHPACMCPKLVKGESCRKGGGRGNRNPRARPKFLLRNYNDPKLEL